MAGSIQRIDRRSRPWRARLRVAGVEHSRTFHRKTDAERWLREELVKVDRGLWHDPAAGGETYRAWSEHWLGNLRGVKPKTRTGYRSLLDSRVLPVFGDVELRSITHDRVQGWVTAMSAEGLSASRIRQARQVLKASLEVAVIQGKIARNPVAGVKIDPDRPRGQKFLDAPQVARLVAAAEEQQDGAGLVVLLLAYSGMRWGELVALRASSVDVARGRVTVSVSATEVAGKGIVIGTPKNHRIRALVLPRLVAGPLAAHLAGVEPGGLVFATPKGRHAGGELRSAAFRSQVWRPAVEAAGLDRDLRIHDLRHTCASLMISAGASVKAVQMALGHSTALITLTTYTHLYDEDLEAVADALDNRFGDTVAAQGGHAPAEGTPRVPTPVG